MSKTSRRAKRAKHEADDEDLDDEVEEEAERPRAKKKKKAVSKKAAPSRKKKRRPEPEEADEDEEEDTEEDDEETRPRRKTGRPAKKAASKQTGGRTGKAKSVGLRTGSRKAAPEPTALEPITPFRRGISISIKFAALTAAVVVVFMGLQGFLMYNLAAQRLDEEITQQGVSMVQALGNTVDRRLWMKEIKSAPEPDPDNPEAPQQKNLDSLPRSALISDWEQRMKSFKESSDQNVLFVGILEKAGGAPRQLAVFPDPGALQYRDYGRVSVPGNDDVTVYERRLTADGTRFRAFEKEIEFGTETRTKQKLILDRWATATGTGQEAQAAKLKAAFEQLAGREFQDLLEADRWLNEQATLEPRNEWDGAAPYVSVWLRSQAVEEVKAQLFWRNLIVSFCGTGAGVLLTVLIATVLTGPLRDLEEDITEVARGNLGRQTRVKATDEIGALAHVFNQMTRNLGVAQEAEAMKQTFERELGIAKEIQDKLLPERIPQIPGFDIQSYYNSAKEVGGDYYDFIVIDQTHLGIIVADVAGKGVPGAMVMTMARSLVRLASVRNVSPADTFKKINRILAKDIRRGMFVTAAYMVLNVKTRQLKLASAGHNPVVLFREETGEIELLKPNGIALGFDKGPIFDNHVKELEVQLEPGDRIVAYTDGVSEALDEDEEEFGDDQFQELVAKYSRRDSKGFINAMVRALDGHRGQAEQSDDITITTLAVLEGSSKG